MHSLMNIIQSPKEMAHVETFVWNYAASALASHIISKEQVGKHTCKLIPSPITFGMYFA